MDSNLKNLIKKAPTYPLWDRFGFSHHHGINLPLAALRTQNSSGIGEFLDLIPLIDWMKEVGFQILQLLPLNDSAFDPSPYNALSSCALHPIYLSLHDLPFLSEHGNLKAKLKDFKTFMEPSKVPYHEVLAAKTLFMKDYFKVAYSEISKTEDYNKFIEKNHYWLDPFASFKTLKEHFDNKIWMDWPAELSDPSNTTYKKLQSAFHTPISFHTFVQYLCHKQFKKAHEYATEKGVYLKGDIPIFISPDSSDVWKHKHTFDLTHAAGAPPDVFNSKGQYWGFPLFKWDVMRQDDYSWWKNRLLKASEYYDIYRIDHIIGFFRIWAIPRGENPINGYYIPNESALFIFQGKSILETMIQASRMFPVGEDLGSIIPDSVHQAIRELGISETKIIRWEKDKETNREFTPYNQYYPFSMTSLSTHDIETVQLWWKHYPEEAKAFAKFKGWEYTPTLSIEHHKQILWDSHHTNSLIHINLLQEYFPLFPEFCWPDPEDERINIPGYILPQNWTYRFRPYLEEILSHEGLKKSVKELLSNNPSIH